MRDASWFCLALILCNIALPPAWGFYLPGVFPKSFAEGDAITVKVTKLSSIKTQVPYDYYSLPYCRPNVTRGRPENLGEILRGDRILNSPYQVKMRIDELCKVLCRIENLNSRQADAFRAKIDDEYQVYMILDNLPVAMVRYSPWQDDFVRRYERGFPVGDKVPRQDGEGDLYVLYNHLNFKILYHIHDAETARVVGFEVQPQSLKHEYRVPWDDTHPQLKTCSGGKTINIADGRPKQLVEAGKEIIFTYNVIFEESDHKWSTRWDTYLAMVDDQIHWFSIINSVMIVLFLTGMVAMIMLRTLRRDILAYNKVETAEEALEETGWKLVHGDVFRTPSRASLLASYAGTGVQLLGMTLVTMIFALLGFLSPANRGSLSTAMLLLYVLMGGVAGYYSGKLYKALRGTHWRGMALRTALLFPGVVVAIFFTLNLVLWGQKSSGAVPFHTLFSLCFMWFGISAPLVYMGSYLGYKQMINDYPVHTNKIPRQIPNQPWYLQPAVSCIFGGVLPFGAVFIELFFILTSIWLHRFYYLFGFLFLVLLILILTCAEIAIVLCYFQLCGEDYHWWWRSYCTAGSSAVYLFFYSAYCFSRLEIKRAFVPMLLYFGYMFIISYGFFCLTGTIGFYACYWFVWKIYGAVKFD